MDLLITDIKSLLQTEVEPLPFAAGKQMAELQTLDNAWLHIEGGKIAGFGEMAGPGPEKILMENPDLRKISASGKLVMPAFCDSHTHLVYPASREKAARRQTADVNAGRRDDE